MEDLISSVVIKQKLTTVFNRNIWYTFESCSLRFKTMQKILTSKTGGESSAGGQTSDGQARGGGTGGCSTQGDEGEANTGGCAQADGGEDSGDLQKMARKLIIKAALLAANFMDANMWRKFSRFRRKITLLYCNTLQNYLIILKY